MTPPAPHRRVLVIDDTPAIRDDFRKLLGPPSEKEAEIDSLEAALFGAAERPRAHFEVECASQGEEGLQLLRRALAAGAPYAVAFVDMRMPPGWDGLETITRLWAEDPGLQVVICTAYSDYSWSEIVERLGHRDGLLVLKKPFDTVEVVQMADALAEKWRLREAVRSRTGELEKALARLQAETEAHKHVTAELHKAERLAGLGVLAAGVAHEINNPLAYTLANLEFVGAELDLARRELPASKGLAEAVNALTEAREGAERIRQIVADMRTLSRVEEREGARADVVSAIEAALRQLSAAVEPRAQVVRELSPVPAVHGEEKRLVQVFANLIQNAAQAIEPGAPERNQIRVRTWIGPEDTVCVEVSDTGCGIAPEVMPRIFDPFFTTKPVGTGTGLGLTICHNIVTGLGGEISVSSAQGAGTSFQITLPADAPVGRGAPEQLLSPP
jgi:two-component system, NtrC family, sensor kinase